MSRYSFVWLQGGAAGMLLSRLAGIGVGMAIEGCEERDCADGEGYSLHFRYRGDRKSVV